MGAVPVYVSVWVEFSVDRFSCAVLLCSRGKEVGEVSFFFLQLFFLPKKDTKEEKSGRTRDRSARHPPFPSASSALYYIDNPVLFPFFCLA